MSKAGWCGSDGGMGDCGPGDPPDDEDYDDELMCTWCGGDGVQENDDPLWYGFDTAEIPCQCCGGTGLRKHQTIF